jgi:hypothetical protein
MTHGRGDATVHRREVRVELDHDRLAGGAAELLLDLGDMPVAGDAVGLDRTVALGEQEGDVGLLRSPETPL